MSAVLVKDRAHELIESLPEAQIPRIVSMMESWLKTGSTVSEVPLEDEEIGEEENRIAAEARARGFVGHPDSHLGLLEELGLTAEDWDRMGQAQAQARG